MVRCDLDVELTHDKASRWLVLKATGSSIYRLNSGWHAAVYVCTNRTALDLWLMSSVPMLAPAGVYIKQGRTPAITSWVRGLWL